MARKQSRCEVMSNPAGAAPDPRTVALRRNTPTQITTDEEVLNTFTRTFHSVAVLQGRVAYFAMSIHAVNPNIWYSVCDYNPHKFLFLNMLYGVSIMIYSRPAMKPISFLNRASFGILGSMTFNYSSMLLYDWLKETLSDRPWLLTCVGFFAGRLMMLHLLAYLYHVDRCARAVVARNAAFDSMYW